MIFYWLFSLVRGTVKLFRIPTPESLAYVNPNAKCPVCGARKGKLRCVIQKRHGPQASNLDTAIVLCQHTCHICGARWFDKPLSAGVKPSTVLPSVARDDYELREDRSAALQQETPQ